VSSGGFVVLNPGGRDPDQHFPNGAGDISDAGHPPVNYHGYAACMRGHFLRNVKSVPEGTRVALVLLRKRNLRQALAAIEKLKARGVRTFISFKESGAHQVADFLSDYGRTMLFRRICAAADGYLSSTPDLESVYRGAGCRNGKFIPTPYPVEEWDRSIPREKRLGFFVGTREFGVPSRNHWQAVALANDLSLELQVPAAVMNVHGRRGLMLLAEIRGSNPFLQIIAGPLPYRDYLRLLGAHRLVLQLDSSAVPGQVAGDALLCRTPCVGGNGAVERIAFPDLAAVTPQQTADRVRELMTDDARWDEVVANSQRIARERLSFSAIRAELEALA